MEVERRRLVRQLDELAPGSLIIITASAGYGKSTLLRQWKRHATRPLALVEVGGVSTPEVLGRRILDELARVLPFLGPAAAQGQRADVDWLCDLLPSVCDRLEGSPIVLALDDAQHLRTDGLREFLKALVYRWPTSCSLVFAGRERPGVPLVRPRLGAPISVLTERDLEFDADELTASAGHPDRARELYEATGGWPAGLRLAAHQRPLRNEQVPSTVDRYLRREVLGEFSHDELLFLAHVAVLAPCSVEILDAVLERDDTGALLADILRRGLPMVTMGSDNDSTVRFHTLLTESLVDWLDEQMPGRTQELVGYAANAGERLGEISFAASLRLRHDRLTDVAEMVYRYMGELTLNGRVDELRGWIEHFPEHERRSNPLLVFGYANTFRPRDERAVRALLRPHQDDDATQLLDGITPARATRRMLTAFGLDPDDADDRPRGAWRQTAGVTRAWELYAADQLDEAATVLHSLASSSGRYRVTDAVRLAKLSIISLDEGDADAARGLAGRAAAVLEGGQLDGVTLSFIVDTAALRLLLHEGELARADELATTVRRKMAMVGDGTMLERATTLLDIADLRLRVGAARREVEELVGEAEGILAGWTSTARLSKRAARLRAAMVTSPARAATGPLRVNPLTTAELRVLHYLPSHFTLKRIADELYVSRATIKSQVGAVYRKLGVTTRAEAVQAAASLGLVTASMPQ